MNYKVLEGKMKGKFVHAVIERRPQYDEEYIIQTFPTKDEAKKLSRHLNLGGGFDGFTPLFFINSLKLSHQND